MTALSLPTVAMDAHQRSTPVINSPDPDQPRYLFPPLSLFSPAFSFTFFFFPSSLQAFFGQGQLSLAAALLTIFFVRTNRLSPPSTCLLTSPPSPSPSLELASRGINLSFFHNLFDKEACFEPTPSFLPDQNLFDSPSLPSGQVP